MPVLRALKRVEPVDLGPVLFKEFSRFAAICAGV